MSAVAAPARARRGRVVLRLLRPHVHITYALLWVLALEGSAASPAGTAWRPAAATWVRVASVVLALLFLRLLDEQKDLDYDRVHHPGRPLVTGEVTATGLRLGMAAAAAVATGLNAALSPAAVLLIVAVLGYALLLAALERASAAVRDRQLLDLAVTYPVQLLLGGYVYGSAAAAGTVSADWRGAVLLALSACVLLHFEFARKTGWEAPAGERLYSTVLGPRRSAAVAALLAAGAVACQLVLFLPADGPAALLLGLTALLPAWGLRQFLRARRGRWPLPAAMGYVAATHLALTVRALLPL